MIAALMAIAGLAAAPVASGCRAVETDRIRASDLAAELPEFSALSADYEIAPAPAPGSRRLLQAADLQRAAARAGIELASAHAVCFERKLSPLTPDQVRTALERALAGTGARLELVDFQRAPAPGGELDFPRLGLSRPPREGPALWRGRIRYGPGRTFPFWSRVRVSVERRAVVARRPLAAGRPVPAAAVEIRTIEGFPFEDPPPASVEEVAGRLPRRLIPAGQVIQSRLLTAPREVEAGQTVEVEAQLGGARLAVRGRAESSGRVGDAIVVRNPESGKRFRATVRSRGVVAVEAAAGEEIPNATHPRREEGAGAGADSGSGSADAGRGGLQSP